MTTLFIAARIRYNEKGSLGCGPFFCLRPHKHVLHRTEVFRILACLFCLKLPTDRGRIGPDRCALAATKRIFRATYALGNDSVHAIRCSSQVSKVRASPVIMIVSVRGEASHCDAHRK